MCWKEAVFWKDEMKYVVEVSCDLYDDMHYAFLKHLTEQANGSMKWFTDMSTWNVFLHTTHDIKPKLTRVTGFGIRLDRRGDATSTSTVWGEFKFCNGPRKLLRFMRTFRSYGTATDLLRVARLAGMAKNQSNNQLYKPKLKL